MTEVFFLLACYGLTFLICDATVFSQSRRVLKKIAFFDALLSCYFCTGFWVSIFWFFALYQKLQACLDLAEGISWELLWWLLAYAFGGAVFTYAFNTIVEALEHVTYALQVYTGNFEAVVERVRKQERDQGIDPDAPEEDDEGEDEYHGE